MHAAKAQPSQSEPQDPVDRMLNVFEKADEKTLQRVDQRIREKQDEIDKLKRMRSAIAKTLRVAKTSTRSNGTRLGDLIFEKVSKPMTVDQLASAVDRPPQAIRMAVDRSKRLKAKDGKVCRVSSN